MQSKDAKKSGVEWMRSACDFVIVARANRPFGVGFPKQANTDCRTVGPSDCRTVGLSDTVGHR